MQYFHPDHMSAAEKLKLELKKVRDKFKLSESDCGSARVQGEFAEFVHSVPCGGLTGSSLLHSKWIQLAKVCCLFLISFCIC